EKGVTVQMLAHKFAHAGLAVDGVHKYGEGAEACVLAQVVSTRPHPSRGQLNLVTVDVGGGKTQEVVCGAPNVPDAGWLVVLAPLGAYLPAKKMKIEPRAIGGVTSEGMLCSESELGLTEDGEGILVFEPGFAKAGTKFVDAIPGASDTIFELDLTPNRPDALGHIGLAREAAALFEIDWKPNSAAKSIFGKDGVEVVTVEIKDAARCAHYGAALVRNVKIAPSPLAIRYRLASLGVRSISNIVDVTNIAMLLSGHPMHAFDLSHVRGGKIVVRRATAGEKFKTLDNVERALDVDDLVIADGEGAVALAGVMGGANSEIGNDTKDVLFECAYFDPRGVRRASRRHGLHTESSHRFERGVDASDTESVLADAVKITLDLAGGKADGWKISSARNIDKTSVKLRHQKLVALAGVEISMTQAKEVLVRLGFDVPRSDATSLEAIVPLHRPDVLREVDLIDEVTRVRGLDKIGEELPPIRSTRGSKSHETREDLLRRARAAAVALGLSEAYPLNFVDPHAHEIFGAPAPSVIIKNPLSELQSVMRTSLLPGLSGAVARAAKHGEKNSRIFAIGPIFLGDPNAKARVLPEERVVLAAILSGDRPAYLSRPEGVDTWDAKGIALGFVERFSRANAEVKRFAANEAPKHLHPRGAAGVVVNGKLVGTFGPLHPDVIDALELPSPCVVAEIDVAVLVEIGSKISSFVPFSRFPAATRDVALVVADAVHAGDVESVLREAAGALAERVELFDRFVGGAIPAGHSSLAFHVVYRSREKTLTDVEVDAQHAKVVEAAKAKFGATLRA
ncbi:MAG: phenylalanine--tRNA ligase subunit beta, partial [Polyangiaceae bacterium]